MVDAIERVNRHRLRGDPPRQVFAEDASFYLRCDDIGRHYFRFYNDPEPREHAVGTAVLDDLAAWLRGVQSKTIRLDRNRLTLGDEQGARIAAIHLDPASLRELCRRLQNVAAQPPGHTTDIGLGPGSFLSLHPSPTPHACELTLSRLGFVFRRIEAPLSALGRLAIAAAEELEAQRHEYGSGGRHA